jgi:hypothetical protein
MAPPISNGTIGGWLAPDPTKNVLELVNAAVKRLDDLHGAEALRGKDLQAAETRRVNDLLVAHDRYVTAQIHHVEATAALRAEHAKEINVLESNRLNAIREVDVLARNTAADRAADAIATLATTTATNADNIRSTMLSTATAVAAQNTNTISGLAEQIAALQKTSYEGKGREAYSDPERAEILAELKSLRDARSQSAGKGTGMNALWGYILGGAGLLITILSMFALAMRMKP